MKWGVFDRKASAIHVAPCVGEYIAEPHELSADCACEPRYDWEYWLDKPIVIHNETVKFSVLDRKQ